MQQDPYYIQLIDANVQPGLAAVLYQQHVAAQQTALQMQQTTQLLTQQNQTIANLTNQIHTMASNKAGAAPTNTEGLFNAFAVIVRSWHTSNRAPTEFEATHWERARDWYKISGNIKEACEKANAGEATDPDTVRLVGIAKLIQGKSNTQITKPGKPSGGNFIQCKRCGRTNHTESTCSAKTDFRGIKLES